ncbi:MAG: 5'-nucleotidase C-terminal domain-containing protein [Oricola sp.]
MKRILKIAAFSVSALAVGTATAAAEYQLEIIHINDLHSRIESINKYDSTCSAEDESEGNCFGGVARLVTAAKQARERAGDGNLLFLNAGDNFQGSLFYTTYKGAAEAEFLNKMGTDVMTVGNHEFDDGEDGLATFLGKVEFPVVSANIVADNASELADKIPAYVIVEKGGEKIGIVGAVANDTAELSSPGEHVMIAEDVEKITAAVKEISDQGVNKIIALTHVGYPRDLAAIAKIPGVDVVVGGHSHTLLSSTDEHAAGPYPTWVDNPVGYKVPVVQAYAYSKYLGDLKVTFSDIGIVEEATGAPILMDASVTPDKESLDRIAELAAPIEELKAKVIGESAEAIEGSRDVCRAMECSMGNLVADAMLDRVKDQGIQIAIQNGGGLRASIDAGEVTMGEVLTVLPFQNTLATFQLKGSDVVAALENGVSQIEEGAGRFPQVAGLKFTFDAEAEPGSRVSNVMVETADGTFEPIDPDATYGVVSNNFMRAGGDGYKVFAEKGMNAYDYGPGLEEVVASYIGDHSPYKPYTDGRITAGKAEMMEEKPAMEEPADVKVEVPETGLAAGTLSSEAPMVKSGESMGMEKVDGGMMEGKKHVIARGDTLWDLAKQYYGDPTMWSKIDKANPGLRARGLEVGTELTIPN